MVSFALSAILIPYAIFLVVAAFFAFINARNLWRYRAEDVVSFFAMFIFLAGLATFGYISYIYLSEIDWTKMVDLGINFKRQF